MSFVSEKGKGTPNIPSNVWFEGDRFLEGSYLSMIFVRLSSTVDSNSEEGSESSESVAPHLERVARSDSSRRQLDALLGADEKFCVSLKLHNKLIGPYDVHILCDRFFIVDGQSDSFWVLLYGEKNMKMMTFNQFYAEAREKKMSKGEFQRFPKGWMRFIVKDEHAEQ